MKKRFVSVKTRYYKKKEAMYVLDHAASLRNGVTRSININPEYTSNNMGLYLSGCDSPRQAFEKMLDSYKSVTGKKPRVDFNALFEHVVILSEEQVISLEKEFGFKKAKQLIMRALKKYAKSIKTEFGFEPFAIDLHYDEGRHEYTELNAHSKPERIFIRNCHAHIQFFNYDFSKKVSPLRHLMRKGKNERGRTNQLNPHFEAMQDLAAGSFASLGFQRGQSKNITGVEHLKKEYFIKRKLERAKDAQRKLNSENHRLQKALAQKNCEVSKVNKQLNIALKERTSVLKHIEKLRQYARELEQSIMNRCRRSLITLNQRLKSIRPTYILDRNNKG